MEVAAAEGVAPETAPEAAKLAVDTVDSGDAVGESSAPKAAEVASSEAATAPSTRQQACGEHTIKFQSFYDTAEKKKGPTDRDRRRYKWPA